MVLVGIDVSATITVFLIGPGRRDELQVSQHSVIVNYSRTLLPFDNDDVPGQASFPSIQQHGT